MAISKGRTALSEKQAEMDVDKWLKSEQAGHDMCGEFSFCAKCNKDDENPCARAYEAMKKENIAALKAEKENAAKAAEKPSTKKATAAKNTGKKSTTKKTATKAADTEEKPAAKKTARKSAKKSAE